MHLSLSTHFCGGELSSVKISFNKEKAGCGMCVDDTKKTKDISFENESCCKNQISLYSVDNNYDQPNPFNKAEKNHFQTCFLPKPIAITYSAILSSLHTNVRPPGLFYANAVKLSDICVFRI